MSKEITKEEFMNKYGNIKVKFNTYYKYTFNYKAELDNERYCC